MARAMVARLGLGLLLLALLLPAQISSNQTAVVPVSSTSGHNTSAAPSPTNATTKAGGSALQSTAGLLLLSVSLLQALC
ncbi:signal transducer CD24 [Ctenodactylus gundi]